MEKFHPRAPDFSSVHYSARLPGAARQFQLPHPTHVDARLDGSLRPSALDGDFWLAPQQAFHFTGDFLRALLGDLKDEVGPSFLGFR